MVSNSEVEIKFVVPHFFALLEVVSSVMIYNGESNLVVYEL